MRTILLLTLGALAVSAQERFRYAVVLEGLPLAVQAPAQKAVSQRQILAAQRSMEVHLSSRGMAVTATTQDLVNAIFVASSEERMAELSQMPGVKYVERLKPMKRHLSRALDLMNVPAAWGAIGGQQNAGAGVKIAIIDSGIDHTHPAFQDNSLSVPAGYPKCQGNDCSYTNRKVIAARSYVQMLANFYGDNPADTRPDDNSPRDRVGHGTALAMVAAGVQNTGPLGTITGVAPKAFLGNYKIYGSPGVNDTTFDDVIIRALEDATADGMDIAVVSSGRPAEWGPRDRGSICSSRDVVCDVRADAIENAARRGLTVVVSAGNDGDRGYEAPSYTSVNTPGTAPSAVTVGATTNAHIFFRGVRAGSRVLNALYGDGPKAAATGPLRDVATTGNDGLACTPLGNGSLGGTIALIARGDCSFDVKINHAQRAGAVGVIIYQQQSNQVFAMTGLRETGIPAVLVGSSDGQVLKGLGGTTVTLDPGLRVNTTDQFNALALFSSFGPAIRDAGIKPELVAVGTDLYVATQRYDPNGDMYDASGYTVAQGTSFAAAMVAGAAALVKGLHPNWNAAQLKSAVVNTANEQVQEYNAANQLVRASVAGTGAGKLDAAEAVKATVTADPATVSLGVITTQMPSRPLQLRNGGTQNASMTIEVVARTPASNARVEVSPTTLSLAPGASSPITVRLTGSRPAAGIYDGFVVIRGGGATLRIPYLFQAGENAVFSVLPLEGEGFIAGPGRRTTLMFKLLDRYGVPVPNVPVRWRAVAGGGSIDVAGERTDDLGIAYADVFAGQQIGEQQFTAEVVNQPGLVVDFFGRTRAFPQIANEGVVNAASLRVDQGLAPGSYISIFGQNLAEATRGFSTPYLPLSLAGVSVSFDVPSRRLSVPGRLSYVSPQQINVQIPWELAGASSALLKVSIGDYSSTLYTVPLQNQAPAIFEYVEFSGPSIAAALKEDFTAISSGNPAEPGRVVQIYANGLGPVQNQPGSGEVSPAEPLARVGVVPTVTIGGRQAEVLFAGLAPSYVGLYQINVRIPPDVGSGYQPVVVTANGIASKPSNLPMR